MNFILLFAEAGATCTSPNPLEWIAIVGLIAGAGIFSVSTGVAGFALAATMIDLISTGASVPTIATAVSGQAMAGAGSVDILASIILSIKGILGC